MFDVAHARNAQLLTSSVPAAGADISYTIPAAITFAPISMRFQLTTSGAVANRTVRLLFTDNNDVEFFRTPSLSVQTATLVWIYTASQAPTAAAVNALNVTLAFPYETILPAGWKVKTLTNLIDTADQYTALTIFGVSV